MKAVIHVGLPKTGSSSIQEFLSLNTEALRERGIRHAPYDPTKGSQYEFAVTALNAVDRPIPDGPPRAILGLHSDGDRQRYAQAYTDWLDAARPSWHEPLFVGSSEHLQAWLRGPKAIKALDDFLHARFSSVDYVLYLRSQTDLIVSNFSERVRRGDAISFEEHFENSLKRHDLFDIVNLWESAAGPDRVTVRLLTPGALTGGDLITDFCAILGTTPDGLARARRMNSALSAEETDLRLRLNRWLPVRRRDGTRNPLYGLALRLLGRGLPYPGTRLTVTDAQRHRVEALFAESNERLRQARFADRDTLF